MSEDDPIIDACESIDEGRSIDWNLTESKATNALEQSSVRALRDLEKITEFNRGLHRPPERTRAESARVTPPEPWGHLSLLEIASAGKSGEVWRAWDPWLQREVALKFLFAVSESGADDSALLEEARSLARVRHPGVVNVYGIGAHAGRIGMWMEFLQGNSLEGEVERSGPLPPRKVATIGLDLCRALGAVVAAGLVHRDIKPSNVVLESGGRTVLTDFGLGKRAAVADRERWRSSGTPLFMAPELLAGEAATPRSDLYALGVTLWWALTGRFPFNARSLEELRAEASAGPPNRLRDERPDAPAALTDAIERAMAPRADGRYATMGEFAEALEAVLGEAETGGRPTPRWVRAAVVGGVFLVVGAAALLLGRFIEGSAPAPAGRFTIYAPPNTTLVPYAACQTISPDGRTVAFAAIDSTNIQRLWIRPLNATAARPIQGTEGAYFLFWSPDSRNLGFFADEKLKTVAISGGSPEILCSAPDPRGGTWGKEGFIVFAPRAVGGLSKVSSEGGAVTEIQRPDSLAHESALRWPHFLPDGRRFFFVSLPPRDGEFDVFVATPTPGARRRVMRADCAPTPAGNWGVIVAASGRLVLQGFDYSSLQPKGSPVVLARAPFSDKSIGQPLASASTNGVILHLDEPLSYSELAWVDRSGRRRETIPLPRGRYEWAVPSPDGGQVITGRRDSPTTVELWLADVKSGQSRRFTFGSQWRIGGIPAWSPRGDRIAFSSSRAGPTNIYERDVDEAGDERLLYASDEQFKEVNDWSPDGKYIVFEQASAQTGWDLWLLPMDHKGRARPYLTSRFDEVSASVSPDGRWLVYTSNASGRPEIYVRSFPTPGAEYNVLDAPGRGVWSRDGREILITHTHDGRIWSVPVSTGPTFTVGTPRALFQGHAEGGWVHPGPVSDRFIEVFPEPQSEPTSIAVDVNVPRPPGR
jgi:serine/threonine-protein kinase